MKARLFIIVCLLLTSSMVLAQEKKQEPKAPAEGKKQESKAQQELKTAKDKLSYTIGYDMGIFLKKNNQDLDSKISIKAINDALAGRKSLVKQEETEELRRTFQETLMARDLELQKAEEEKNLKEGQAFLAKNKTKEGVTALPSGLQYKVIKEGTGKTPKETDTVLLQYRSTLIDGKEFENSYKNGKPEAFPVNSVPKGWTEALLLMKEGSKWQLFIPSDLAYGEAGQDTGSVIVGPNATVIVEIELVSIKAD